jgi:CheY-like chemotaxis protein
MSMNEAPLLLVEDNPDDVALIWRAIDKAELKNPLRVVRDGEHAIEYLSGHGIYADRSQYPIPALMLLDLKLPRKSGFEVLRWLGDHPELRSILVVAMSSCRAQIDIDRAYELGIHSYLVKPRRWEEMVDLIRTLADYWIKFNAKPHHRADLAFASRH